MRWIAPFLFFWISINSQAALMDRIEATVNASIVLHSDLLEFEKTKNLRKQLDPSFLANTPALDQLIQDQLILQDFPISDAEVEREILQIQNSNRISRKELIAALQNQGFQYSQYVELIRVGTAKRQLVDREIRSKITITEDDIRNYYFNEKKQDLGSVFLYSLQMISLDASQFPSKSELRKTMNIVVQKLKTNSFAEVAKEFSHDPSAPQGGSLGELSSSQISPLFLKEIRKLRSGQVSPFFGSEEQMVFLLKLVSVKSSDREQFEAIKNKVIQEINGREIQKQIDLWVERKKNSSVILFPAREA